MLWSRTTLDARGNTTVLTFNFLMNKPVMFDVVTNPVLDSIMRSKFKLDKPSRTGSL